MGKDQSKIKYYDGSQYTGQLNQNGKEHGQGMIEYAKGDILKGRFLNGQCIYANIKYHDGNRYQGEMHKNQFHGMGTFTNSQATEKGLFRYGKFVFGVITFNDGTVYQGSLQNGQKSGKGTLQRKDGFHYSGYFKHDKFDGNGQVLYTDKSSYKGTFCKGIESGKGRLIRIKDGKPFLQYDGEFFNGNFQGSGVLRYSNGDSYQGQFIDGKRQGYGEYRYANGDIYKGKWINDLKNDTNCVFAFSTKSVYKGGIKDGKYHGKGKLTKTQIGDYYDGQYLNGLKHGQGCLRKAGQWFYIGYFNHDKQQGPAKVVYQNRDIFEGTFVDGVKSGKGILYDPENKFRLQAHYNAGLKDGPYHLIDKRDPQHSYQERGTYVNGQKHGQIIVEKQGFKSKFVYQNGVKVKEQSM